MPTVTIVNTAIEIVAANEQRLSLIVVNNGPGNIFIGQTSTVVEGTGPNGGVKIVPNGTFTEDSGGRNMYLGPIYAIADAGGNAAVSYWERTRK